MLPRTTGASWTCLFTGASCARTPAGSATSASRQAKEIRIAVLLDGYLLFLFNPGSILPIYAASDLLSVLKVEINILEA